MTNSLIPYSFTPGTKAKAQEVNANFNALADKIESNNSTAVHENTESTITGKKTFTKPIYSAVRGDTTDGNIVITNLQDGEYTDSIIAMNPSNIICGSLRISNGDGYNETILTAAKEDGSECSSLCIRNTDGISYATCPTYTEDYTDTSDKIVTTNYMANHWTITKATTSASASKARPAVVVENYRNQNSWYRVWSDGWIEQGGRSTAGVGVDLKTINLLKKFDSSYYTIVMLPTTGLANSDYNNGMSLVGRYTTYFTYYNGDNTITSNPSWVAFGY